MKKMSGQALHLSLLWAYDPAGGKRKEEESGNLGGGVGTLVVGWEQGMENLSTLSSGVDGSTISPWSLYCVDMQNDNNVVLDSKGWG